METMEQREQSDACIDSAESGQRKAEGQPMEQREQSEEDQKKHDEIACVYRFSTTIKHSSIESANGEKKCLVKSEKVRISHDEIYFCLTWYRVLHAFEVSFARFRGEFCLKTHLNITQNSSQYYAKLNTKVHKTQQGKKTATREDNAGGRKLWYHTTTT